MSIRYHFFSCVLLLSIRVLAQSGTQYTQKDVEALKDRIQILEYTELVQSMSQRSLLTPSYFSELKALIARQAYNFWQLKGVDPLVSHLNVYSALYYANKYLGYDSVNLQSYNQALGHDASVISIKFGQNKEEFYSGGSDGRVIRWTFDGQLSTPEVIYQGDHLIRSVDISHDDRWIMVVTKNNGLVLIDNATAVNSEISPKTIMDPQPVQTAVFMPGENKIVAVSRLGELKVMGFGTEKTLGFTGSRVSEMTVNPASQQIYLGDDEGSIQIWEDSLSSKLYFKESYVVNAMALSPDFNILALGREKGDVILWDLEKKSLIRTISGHQSAITDVDFSPDGKKLLSASRDRTVRVWDVDNSKKLPLVMDDHNDWVMSACFTPDGNGILSGSRDNYIRYWPTRHSELAERICNLVTREMTAIEWAEYVGKEISYQNVCPSR